MESWYKTALDADYEKSVGDLLDYLEGRNTGMATKKRLEVGEMGNIAAIWVLRAVRLDVDNEVAEMALDMAIEALKEAEDKKLTSFIDGMGARSK